MPRRLRHDKKRHRAARDLSAPEWVSLAFHEGGDPGGPFASDAARERSWRAHREELLAGSSPGRRPGAFWDYDAPCAPDRDDYRGRHDGALNTIVPDDAGTLTTDEFDLARLRYLAAGGHLDGDEIAELVAKPQQPGLTPYARERAEAAADAALEGLAARGDDQRDR